MTSGWHLSGEQVESYATSTIDEPAAWSVEKHVERCSTCAAALSAACTRPALQRVRTQVLRAAQPSSRRPLQLVLSPTLRLAWPVAVGVVVLATTALDFLHATRFPALFLVAPLLPLAGIAASCAPSWDSSSELVASTPTSALRLLLLRSAATLGLSVPALLLTGLLVDASPLPWLLPSAALVGMALALSAWLRVEVATALAAAVWGVVALGPAALDRQMPVAMTETAAPAWCAVLLAAIALLVLGRHSYEPRGVLR